MKKQQKECSDNRGDQAKTGDTSPSDVSFSSIGSDTINEVCIIREEVNRETQNNSQMNFQYLASNYQWQSQSLPKSDAVSGPKAPPPLPPHPHPPCIPVTTSWSAEPLLRQSVEFTKESLKVSVKRTHQLTLASALSNNGKRGSELGATPAVKSGGEKSAAVQVEKVSNRGTLIGKCPTSGTEVGKDSITGSEFDCDTDSFVELVKYSTMTNPLPPISPKYKNPPDISLPTNNNNSSTYSCTESLPSTTTSKDITVYSLTSSVSPISTAAQCSITTQTRLNSHPPSAMTGTTNNPFSSWPYQPLPKEPPKPKPTPSSIYRQLVADKKIIPKGNRKKSRSKTSQKPKKSPPSPSASKHAQVSSKSSTREGLSSKLRAPLCATFPTFVIPQFPMGGSNDPGLLVSPVWLGPGSLSGMMPTVTPPNAPPITSNSNNWSQSGGPHPSMSTGSDSTKHGSLSSSSTALPQELATRSGQISPLEFGSSQVRSFHSQTFPGITLIPCELPLKASTSSTVSATTSSVGQTSNHPVSLPNSTATATTVSSARSPASDKHKKSSRKSNRTPSKSSTFVYKPDERQSSVSTAQAILPSMWNASTQTTQNSTSISSSPATPYGPWTSNMPQSQDNTRASASQARSSSAWTANRLQSQSGASVSATHAKSSSPWIARTCMPQPQVCNNSLSMSQVNSSHVWSASTQMAQIGTSLSALQSKATSPWTGSVQQPHVSISLPATQARSSGSLTSVTTQSQTRSITSVTQAKLHSPWTAGAPRTQVGTSLPGSHTTLSSSWTAVMPQAQVSTRVPASQTKVSTVWSASTPTTQAYPSFSVCQAKPNSVWSANMPQPHIDMYPPDGSLPLNQSSRQGAGKTLSSHPINEQPQSDARNTACPSSMVLSAPPISLSTTPMSPPTTRPPKKPGQYRFHSVSSVVRTSSSAVRPTSLTGVRASLKSSSSSSSEATPSFTTSSFSLSAPPGETTAVLSSSGPVSQDVNSMEYRKFILKKVQQWNEQKKKMLQRGAERMKGPLTPSPLSLDEASFKSPTSHDGAFSPTESFCSANPSPKLNSGLTERLPSDSQSLRRSSDPFNSSGGGDNNISPLFGRPKLMTVAPPITFTDTLPSSLASSTASSFEDDKTLLLSPTVPSVVSSAIRMEDVLTASYSSSIVAPSIVVNSAFIGDISSMSRWELEQLYNHHLEKLEQQKKFITFLESHLKKIHKQHDSLSDHKPTQTEVYQRFLSFIVEPDMVPDVPVIGSDRFGYGHLMKKPSSNGAENAPPIHLNEVIKGGTFDRPVLNEKYDFYANFGQCS